MTRAPISVAVLISSGQNPVSGMPRACRGDAVALALGQKLAGGASAGGALRVIYAGSPEERSLRDYLAFGAGTIEVIPVAAGVDVLPALAASLAGADLILMGTRAERGAGSGVLPYALARSLGRPIVANVLDATLSGGEARVFKFLPKGKRRQLAVRLPAVLTVHALAPVALGYAHARRVAGAVTVLNATVADAPTAVAAPLNWTVSPTTGQPVRLRAAEKIPPHARLQAAIASEAKGGVVVNEGSHVDKAQVVLDYLREHQLVDLRVGG